jgi:NADPH:quinone reductase-like Zn-dependent oxidoreductase
MSLLKRVVLGIAVVLVVGVASLAVAISYTSPCESSNVVAENPTSMTAVTSRCYGGPDVLRIESIAKPTPADDQMLVRVHVAALNPLDWHTMRGEPYFMRLGGGLGRPQDTTIGVDFAGTVEAVGKNITRFKPGDQIFGGRSGALAQYVLASEASSVVHKPANITSEEAAAIPIAAITALQGLRDRGHLQAGQSVLINGASGGVGTFAVQIAKSMGAQVTGVCSTRNVELVRSLGADLVVDYTKENFTDREERYDLILDNVGSQSLGRLRGVLKPTGRIVIVGGMSRDPWLGPLIEPLKAMAVAPFVDHEMGMFVAQLNQTDLTTLAKLMESGAIRSVIDKTFALNEVSTAMEYLETGRARGKVVVNISQ